MITDLCELVKKYRPDLDGEQVWEKGEKLESFLETEKAAGVIKKIIIENKSLTFACNSEQETRFTLNRFFTIIEE